MKPFYLFLLRLCAIALSSSNITVLEKMICLLVMSVELLLAAGLTHGHRRRASTYFLFELRTMSGAKDREGICLSVLQTQELLTKSRYDLGN